MVVYRFADFRALPEARRLDWQDKPVSLTAKQFDLLIAFLERPGVPLAKQDLQQRVWPDTFVEENNLTQHVFQLRKALAKCAGSEASFIETLPKVGYQFVAPVSVERDPPPAEPLPPPSTTIRWRWVAAAVLILLFAGTLGYGKRQWDFWMADEPAPPQAPLTVAILPFDSPFGAAFAAELAASLGRLDNIQIQAVHPAALDTRADFTLSGKLLSNGATVELRRNGVLLWQHNLTGDLASLHAEIAGLTAGTLQESGGARLRSLSSRRAPANKEAYVAYLHAAQLLTSRRGNPIDAFQRAIVADPGFAGAYAGMALYYMLVGFNQAEEPRMVWDRARQYARKAIELEPENGEARMILAYVAAYAGQDEIEAERITRAAMQSDPGSVSIQLLAGQLLSRLGRFTEGEAILQKAIQSDPTLLLGRQILAQHYYLSRQFDLSKREAWRIIRMAPKNAVGYGLLVPPMWATGDWRLATLIAGRAQAAGLNQPFISMGLAYTYGRTGRLEEARRIVRTMDEQARMSHVSSLQRAVAHVGIGNYGQAVQLLAACIETGCVNPSLLRLDPVFDPLRDRPQFAALVR